MYIDLVENVYVMKVSKSLRIPWKTAVALTAVFQGILRLLFLGINYS